MSNSSRLVVGENGGLPEFYVLVFHRYVIKYLTKDHPFSYRIYLVDHMWTFRPGTARQQLESHPSLADTVVGLLGKENEAPEDRNVRALSTIENGFLKKKSHI